MKTVHYLATLSLLFVLGACNSNSSISTGNQDQDPDADRDLIERGADIRDLSATLLAQCTIQHGAYTIPFHGVEAGQFVFAPSENDGRVEIYDTFANQSCDDLNRVDSYGRKIKISLLKQNAEVVKVNEGSIELRVSLAEIQTIEESLQTDLDYCTINTFRAGAPTLSSVDVSQADYNSLSNTCLIENDLTLVDHALANPRFSAAQRDLTTTDVINKCPGGSNILQIQTGEVTSNINYEDEEVTLVCETN